MLGGHWGQWESVPQPMRTRAAAFAPGGLLARRLAEDYRVVAKVRSTLFVHGGLPGPACAAAAAASGQLCM